MSDRVISTTVTYTGYDAAITIDATDDWLLLQQSGVYKKINRNVLLGLSSAPLGTTDSQSPTNKTFDNSNIYTIRDDRLTLQDSGDVTRQATFQLSGITAGQTRVMTLPDASTTLVGTGATQTLTNKTLTSPTITGGTIANSTITVDAIGEFSAANGVTVDGLNIKDGKLNTNNSVVAANITEEAVTPAKLVTGTGSGWGWASWVPTLTNLSGGTLNLAKYIQVGKTVFFRLQYTLGGAGVAGSVRFTLPVTPASDEFPANGYNIIGTAGLLDNGTANIVGMVNLDSTTTSAIVTASNAGSSYTLSSVLSSTIPFTWAANDQFFLRGSYEAA